MSLALFDHIFGSGQTASFAGLKLLSPLKFNSKWQGIIAATRSENLRFMKFSVLKQMLKHSLIWDARY